MARRLKGRDGGIARKCVIYAVLILGAAFMLLPFYWLLRSSLASSKEVLRPIESLSDLAIREVRYENYPEVFSAMPFWRYMLNSIIVTACVVVGAVLSSSLCAYAFAFCKTRYNKPLFMTVLGTMMLPWIIVAIPTYIMYRYVGWMDSFKPLIVPAFFGVPFAIFLFRQFFKSLPYSLIEAAKIDGATSLQIYSQIVLPLSKPAATTVAIFMFMASWNDFMGPLLYLNSQEKWTLQIALNSFMGEEVSQWNLLMAATVMVLLPALLVFFFLQRYFVQGMSLTGMKG